MAGHGSRFATTTNEKLRRTFDDLGFIHPYMPPVTSNKVIAAELQWVKVLTTYV
jgi:hypothetical protein